MWTNGHELAPTKPTTARGGAACLRPRVACLPGPPGRPPWAAHRLGRSREPGGCSDTLRGEKAPRAAAALGQGLCRGCRGARPLPPPAGPRARPAKMSAARPPPPPIPRFGDLQDLLGGARRRRCRGSAGAPWRAPMRGGRRGHVDRAESGRMRRYGLVPHPAAQHGGALGGGLPGRTVKKGAARGGALA